MRKRAEGQRPFAVGYGKQRVMRSFVVWIDKTNSLCPCQIHLAPDLAPPHAVMAKNVRQDVVQARDAKPQLKSQNVVAVGGKVRLRKVRRAVLSQQMQAQGLVGLHLAVQQRLKRVLPQAVAHHVAPPHHKNPPEVAAPEPRGNPPVTINLRTAVDALPQTITAQADAAAAQVPEKKL